MTEPGPLNSSSPDVRDAARHQFFETEDLQQDLGGQTARGGAVTIAAKGLELFLGIGATIVLARLLTPEIFGIMAMAIIVQQFVIYITN